MKIIGINGFKRSGKNTAFELASEWLAGTAIRQIGFADSLKCIGLEALGFKRSDAELIRLADSIKENANILVHYEEPGTPSGISHDLTVLHDESGREFFQNLGNLARERFGKNFWVDQVLPTRLVVTDNGHHTRLVLNKHYPDVDYLFITDLRYENEADRVKALGGVVWEVVRPGCESDGHASEQRLPEELIDWCIYNDGDLDALRAKVGAAVVGTLNV